MAKGRKKRNSGNRPRAAAPRPQDASRPREDAQRAQDGVRSPRQRAAAEPGAKPRDRAGNTAPRQQGSGTQAPRSAAQPRQDTRRRKAPSRGSDRPRKKRSAQNVEPFRFQEVKPGRRPRYRENSKTPEIIYRSLLAVMIAAALLFVALVFFEVKYVEVTGSDRYLAEYVRNLSGLQEGDKLLFINRYEISQNLFKELPYIKEIKVRQKFPNTVVIQLVERKPAAKLRNGGIAYIIDEEGRLLEYTAMDADFRVPVINGAAPETLELGKVLQFSDPLMLESLQTVLSEIVHSSWIENITQINMERTYAISFNYGNRFVVNLGDTSNLEYKLTVLTEMLTRIRESYQENVQGNIDLSNPEMSRFLPLSGGV